MFKFEYATYQDVRHNLFKYAIVPFNLAGFATASLIIPPTWKHSIEGALDDTIPAPWMNNLTTLGPFVVSFTCSTLLAFLLIELLKFHDRFLDKRITQWRKRYDTETIIPNLTRQFGKRLPDRFYVESKRNTPQFMEKLFYRFVGDYETKIPKNLLIRFYERITIYWLTQVNEFVLVVLIAACAIGGILGPAALVYRTTILWVVLFADTLVVLNRAWAFAAKTAVETATAAEIDAITSGHWAELEAQTRAICESHSIPFETSSQLPSPTPAP